MGSTRDADKRQAAAHEAGHAVVAVVLGANIEGSSLVPPSMPDLNPLDWRGQTHTDSNDPQVKGVTVVAGAISESRYNDEPIDVPRDEPCEWQEAIQYAAQAGVKPESFVRTGINILNSNWEAVLYFGALLCERDSIPGEEATRLIRERIDTFNENL